jgi:hypothetical protein
MFIDKELVKEFFNLVEPQTSYRYAVLPYIKGLTEPLEKLAKPVEHLTQGERNT